ncbi:MULTISPECIES: hypothetical protein [Streptomyces]|uniref:hypothetical protein n=1 Tax=Streptomyces TaxID=1883 RepID=UPI001F273878|nr:hypothetical protein [Streptomyces sp. AS58]
MTKDLTYRNLGSTPLTLKLTTEVTGPDGALAPDGMFTVDPAPTAGKNSRVQCATRPCAPRMSPRDEVDPNGVVVQDDEGSAAPCHPPCGYQKQSAV